MAILKRAVFIIFAKDHIYYRPPQRKGMQCQEN